MSRDVVLDSDLLRRLVEKRFGGDIDALQTAWEAAPYGGDSDGPPAPDDGTVYRWLKEGRLPRPKQLAQLCVVLDIDPVCMLVAEGGDTRRSVDHLVSSFQIDNWKSPALKFMTDFFGRQYEWPPPRFARERYGRSWVTHEFRHDAAVDRNFDAALELSGSQAVYAERPQVYHFGFRQPGYFSGRWLQYGIVERYGERVRLVHINGHTETYSATTASAPSTVMTWFGRGDAVFRVASLHDFSVRLIGRIDDDRPRVTFAG